MQPLAGCGLDLMRAMVPWASTLGRCAFYCLLHGSACWRAWCSVCTRAWSVATMAVDSVCIEVLTPWVALACARPRPPQLASKNGDFYDTTRVKNRNIPTAEEGGETAGPVLCREVELERRGTATPTSHPHQGNARLPSASTLLNGQSKRILLSADGERSRVLLRKHSLSCPPR